MKISLCRFDAECNNMDFFQARAMFKNKLNRSWGQHIARGWASMLLNRLRDYVIPGFVLVQVRVQYFTLYCSPRILRPLRSQLWRSKRSVQLLPRPCPWSQPGGDWLFCFVFPEFLVSSCCFGLLSGLSPNSPFGARRKISILSKIT